MNANLISITVGCWQLWHLDVMFGFLRQTGLKVVEGTEMNTTH